MENTKIFKEFSDNWDIVDRDEEFFLVSKTEIDNKRRAISVYDNEEGSVYVDTFDVKHLLDQEEETIDYILEYNHSKDEIPKVKEFMRENRDKYTRNDVLLYCDLKTHHYGEFVGAEELLFDQDDVKMWYNSEKIVETIKLYVNM